MKSEDTQNLKTDFRIQIWIRGFLTRNIKSIQQEGLNFSIILTRKSAFF